MAALNISYTIARADPAPTDPPTTGAHSFPLDASTPHAHLVSLEQALGDARTQMNARLTEWKDVLKDVEKPPKKNGGKKQQDEDEDDEDEDEEGGDE
ncbi:hypothetical protein JCM8202_006165 [Rhodotorula sphaerocarpa]